MGPAHHPSTTPTTPHPPLCSGNCPSALTGTYICSGTFEVFVNGHSKKGEEGGTRVLSLVRVGVDLAREVVGKPRRFSGGPGVVQ